MIIFLMIFSFNITKAQHQKENINYVYGNWQFSKVLYRDLTKLTSKQVEQLKKSILHVEKQKIYFDKIKFIDTCKYLQSKIKVSNIFDKRNDEYYWYENGNNRLLPLKYTGPLPKYYTKQELSKIISIDLGCDYGLSNVYLKQDTLIFNNLGGITLFMVKK